MDSYPGPPAPGSKTGSGAFPPGISSQTKAAVWQSIPHGRHKAVLFERANGVTGSDQANYPILKQLYRKKCMRIRLQRLFQNKKERYGKRSDLLSCSFLGDNSDTAAQNSPVSCLNHYISDSWHGQTPMHCPLCTFHPVFSAAVSWLSAVSFLGDDGFGFSGSDKALSKSS